jgi:hypothetical protein
MAPHARTLLRPALPGVLLACAAAALAPAAAASAGSAAPAALRPRAHGATLLTSRRLWATIDVCSPADQPNTVGIRGSMPGDAHARDRMYMAFRLEYRNRTSGHWANLSSGGAVFVFVGTGASARQGGRSFQLMPVAGQPAFTLRGVVSFQWRRGRRVIGSASRVTETGHTSLAGADPAGYSAATCAIG